MTRLPACRRVQRRPWLVAVMLLALAVAGGCGSSQRQSMAEREKERLRALSSAGLEAGGAPREEAWRVRWNPVAACESSPFEVLVDGEWLRADLKPAEATSEALLASFEGRTSGTVEALWARGHLRPGKVVSYAFEQPGVVLEVTWLGREEPPASAPTR
jgi:hypothetical protein